MREQTQQLHTVDDKSVEEVRTLDHRGVRMPINSTPITPTEIQR